jgi:MFS family permease
MVTEDAPPQVRTDTGAIVSLALGFVSLIGLVFPPFIGLGVAGIAIGWISQRRVARDRLQLKGRPIAIAGIVLSVIGTLLSLVIPGFIVSVWIYAIFHGGQCPGNGC